MAEAACATALRFWSFSGAPRFSLKSVIEMNNRSLVKMIFCDVKLKSIVSYLEVSYIPTTPSVRHTAYQLGN